MSTKLAAEGALGWLILITASCRSFELEEFSPLTNAPLRSEEGALEVVLHESVRQVLPTSVMTVAVERRGGYVPGPVVDPVGSGPMQLPGRYVEGQSSPGGPIDYPLRYELARRLFVAHLGDLSDDAAMGASTAMCSITKLESSVGGGALGVLSILTGGLLNLLGMPALFVDVEARVEVALLDEEGQLLANHEGMGRGRAYQALYWGYNLATTIPSLDPSQHDGIDYSNGGLMATARALEEAILVVEQDIDSRAK